VDPRTSPEYLAGFDFSAGAVERRRRQIPGRAHHEFRLRQAPGGLELALRDLEYRIPVDGLPELSRHLLLKQLLNIHSTLVMGRLGRYQGNLMTWVTPTNGKLVDRATRYVQHLLAEEGAEVPSYEDVVRRLFVEMDQAGPGEAVVLRTCRSLRHRRAAS